MSELDQYDMGYVILRKKVTTISGLLTEIKARTKNGHLALDLKFNLAANIAHHYILFYITSRSVPVGFLPRDPSFLVNAMLLI